MVLYQYTLYVQHIKAQANRADPGEESVLVSLGKNHHWIVERDCNTIHFTKEKDGE